MADALTVFTFTAIVVPLILALALGFVPLLSSVHLWMEVSRSNRSWALLVIFMTAWLLSWIAFAGLVARLYYTIAGFYFDSTFGKVIGVTRPTVQLLTRSILVELWLRQVVGWLKPTICFAKPDVTCQLADMAERLGNFGVSPAFVAILPSAFSFVIARWIALRRARGRADQATA